MSEPFFKKMDCDKIEDALGAARFYISVDRANKLLKDRGLVVSAHQSNIEVGAWYENNTEPNPTHTALLIQIEPLEKDSAEKIVEDMLKQINEPYKTANRIFQDLVDRARKLRGEK